MKSAKQSASEALDHFFRAVESLPEEDARQVKRSALARIKQSLVINPGRTPIPRPCPKCGAIQPTAREAQSHCARAYNRKVKGKYAHVPTSSADFIERKHEGEER